MASTFDEKQQAQLDASTAQSAGSNLAQTSATTGAASGAGQDNSLANATANTLSQTNTQTQNSFGTATNNYTQYQQSQNVLDAQSYLQSILDAQPGAYESKRQESLDELYGRIMNREKFSYDLNGDMLYQQYAQKYQQQGKQAMRDTMGQAAALTGGYGSSYASTAGNQAYQQYLTQLNDIVPELYNAAYSRYTQEGQDLLNQYNVAQTAEQTDYSRYQDALNAWQNDRSYAQNAYDNAQSMDYQQWSDAATRAYADQQTQQQNAYNYLMACIQKGVLPAEGDAMYDTAGLTFEQAKTLAQKYGYGKKKSSGSRKSSSSGTKTAAAAEPQVVKVDTGRTTPYGNKIYTRTTALSK